MIKMILLIIVFLLAMPAKVMAVCPVCTIAIGAGVGLSRYFGIDDTVTGIWIGGLILSSGLWFSNWLKHKNIFVKNQTILSVIGFYLLTLVPLYMSNVLGHYLNTLWGVDKLILGIATGSAMFLASIGLDKYLRIKKQGKVLFYYQRVILPVFLLIISSLIFYFIIS